MQEPCAATAAHEAHLPILARMMGCVSTFTSQGSIGSHLRSASGHRVWAAARAHHSYVRMPFGLPSVASAYQRNMRRVLAAQEARYHAVLEEMETVFREPPEPPEPPEAQGPGGS